MSRLARRALFALLMAHSGATFADPGYYVVTPYDRAHERVIDFRYWTVKMPNTPAVVWPEFGIGYGVNTRWTTHLLASYVGSRTSEMVIDTLNWQNDVLLTQGEWPIDVAIHTLLQRANDRAEKDAFEIGPALQTDIGRTQLNANVFFERFFGNGAPRPTELKYQWQVRYRWHPLLNVGLQGFGELGPWNDWWPRSRQSHRAGPAVFGTLRFSGDRTITYQAAYLLGSVYGRHADMFSMRVAFAF